ncbi:hypothetical protein K1X12_14725 [Hyphomonas sp. WL0036]|uniref:hypothetical protein n=1 Tax=Hyphomonas sediminis TaxID=2866160 RepID=UPI001C7F6A23|nr:hypothetical protein [Hyphomonas sediminis]MBY9068163.1 hypothetical protein [Hyphomonas sediminis]
MPVNFQSCAVTSFAALLTLAAVAVLPSCAQVQTTTVGTMKAQIGDQAYAGEFLEVPSEGTTTASFQAFGPVTNLALQAHDPRAESRMKNVLTLDLSLMGNDASASITAATVSYWPEGMGKAFYTSDEGGEAQVSLETLSLDTAGGQITGRFNSTVCRKENHFAEIDMSDCLTIDGSFETALLQN